jgi:hypothetical protein
MGWVGRHPGLLILLGAVFLGQILQKVAQPLVAQAVPSSELPIVPIVVLALALVLAILVVWFRARLGTQLDATATERTPSVVMPESLPSRYALADPAGRVVAGVLGVIDLALLLLLQNTLRGPLLALNEHYGVASRTLADAVFVGVIVVLALVLLMKVWRASGPVLVLLMWWGLDRVVPTVGFVGARPTLPQAVAVAGTPVGTPPPRATPTPVLAPAPTVLEPTVASAAGGQEATLPAQPTEHIAGDHEGTVLAQPTGHTAAGQEGTVLAQPTPPAAPGDDATLLAEQTLKSLREDAGGTP